MKDTKINIRDICYRLYKSDWYHSHGITTQRKVYSIRDYRKFLRENNLTMESYSYDKYLKEFGYGGELYVSYEEFMKNEYLDKNYICSLLKGCENLISDYQADIESME